MPDSEADEMLYSLLDRSARFIQNMGALGVR